eukprot:CFRG6959T1
MKDSSEPNRLKRQFGTNSSVTHSQVKKRQFGTQSTGDLQKAAEKPVPIIYYHLSVRLCVIIENTQFIDNRPMDSKRPITSWACCAFKCVMLATWALERSCARGKRMGKGIIPEQGTDMKGTVREWMKEGIKEGITEGRGEEGRKGGREEGRKEGRKRRKEMKEGRRG